MSTSFSILGAVVVFAAAQLLLRKDAPAYAFLLSVGAALFVPMIIPFCESRST